MASPADTSKTNKLERYNTYLRRLPSAKLLSATSKLLFLATLLAAVLLILLLLHHPLPLSPPPPSSSSHRILLSPFPSPRAILLSATPRRPSGLSVLVTGAAGFIGSHCSLALKNRGDGVVGLDTPSPPSPSPSLKRHRQSLLARHRILLLEFDLNDPLLLPRLLASHPFSHVLHLAARHPAAARPPARVASSNVAAFAALLEHAAKSPRPPPAVVWASSSSVYGLLNKTSPFSEQDSTDRPASLFAATKKAGEVIAHSYNHIYGLSITGLRLFTVYGPMGRPDMAYFSFTKSILEGKPITIFKDVARDFTYIDDVVRGCLGAIDTAERSTGGVGGGPKSGPAQLRIYNIGGSGPVLVGRMVGVLEGILGVRARRNVVALPEDNGDVPFTRANVSLAERDFGYRAATDLETGLRKFVGWYVRYYEVRLKGGGGEGSVVA